MVRATKPSGPLAGLKVLEFAGLAPGPFGCMMLADLGADVVRIDRAVQGSAGATLAPSTVPTEVLNRGRRSIGLDLKAPEAVELTLSLVDEADVLVESFRPGVMERLGLGPDICLQRNPRLVYGRMTGWGQDGPLAEVAGHDINYIAVAGALHLIGDRTRPIPPANLLGDFAGGGLLLAFGILAALFERTASDCGQVVDAAMVDGASLITTMLHGLRAVNEWDDKRGENMLDGAAPFYNTYETSDAKHIGIGAIEPQFHTRLVEALGLTHHTYRQGDRAQWSTRRDEIAAVIRTRTRDEWVAMLGSSDACVSPVLALSEVPQHPHHQARASFLELDGVVQPAPAPRFGRTPSATPMAPSVAYEHGLAALADWQVPQKVVDAAFAANALVVAGAPV